MPDKKNVSFGIGAPSLTGVDANDTVAKEFVAGDFPLDVKVTNKAMFAIILPGKFHLQPFHDLDNCSATVKITSLDSMQRMTSDLESIAENHKKEGLVTIEAEVIDSDVQPPADNLTPTDDTPPAPVEAPAPASKKAKGG